MCSCGVEGWLFKEYGQKFIKEIIFEQRPEWKHHDKSKGGKHFKKEQRVQRL